MKIQKSPVVVRNVRIGEGIPKIAAPIVGAVRGQIVETAREIAQSPAQLAEWRADWFESVSDPEQVLETARELRRALGEKPLLFTFRTSREGGEREIPMRRHRVMIAKATDGEWLCDVGIGEVCPRWPIRMEEGLVQRQQDEAYRLVRDRFLGWVLMDEHEGQWRPFYSFTEEPQLPVDFIAPTFYCEKHPDSPFTAQEMFSLKTAHGRITLDGHVFKVFDGGKVTVRELADREMDEAYARFGLTI